MTDFEVFDRLLSINLCYNQSYRKLLTHRLKYRRTPIQEVDILTENSRSELWCQSCSNTSILWSSASDRVSWWLETVLGWLMSVLKLVTLGVCDIPPVTLWLPPPPPSGLRVNEMILYLLRQKEIVLIYYFP